MNNYDKLKKISLESYNFLINFKNNEYSDGKYCLKNGVYVNIETYSTKLRKETKFEAHRKHIDIQFMITGTELVTVAPVDSLIMDIEYSNDKDIAFFSGEDEGIDFLLTENNFIILTPFDAHRPCICINSIQKVRKAVIKVPIRS